jgi:cell division protein FtsZ
MGSGSAEGENRALEAVSAALESPLLNDNDIRGARNILLNISSGSKAVLMDEIASITDYVQEAAGNDCDIIWGNCTDETLGEKIMVTVIATGFETIEQRNTRIKKNTYKITHVDTTEMTSVKQIPVVQETEVIEEEEPMKEPEPEIKLVNKNEVKIEKKEVKKEEDNNPRQFAFNFDMFAPVEDKVTEIVAEPIAEVKNEAPIVEIVAEEIKEEIVAEIITPVVEQPIAQIEPVEETKEEETPFFELKKQVEQPIVNTITPEEEIISFVKKEEATPIAEREEIPPVAQRNDSKTFITNDDKLGVVNNAGNDRINRLKSMSMKLNNSNLEEIEKVPAYMRRNIDLEETPDAREINVSKYNVVNGENGPEIKKNNSFLHDNVD